MLGDTMDANKPHSSDKNVQDALSSLVEPERRIHDEDTLQTTSTATSVLEQATNIFLVQSSESSPPGDNAQIETLRPTSLVHRPIDHDHFFDIESETTSDMEQFEGKLVPLLCEPSNTLPPDDTEKLQRDATIQQTMDEFCEPELLLTTVMTAASDEPEPVQATFEETPSTRQKIASEMVIDKEIKPFESRSYLQQNSRLEKKDIHREVPSEQHPVTTEMTELVEKLPLPKEDEHDETTIHPSLVAANETVSTTKRNKTGLQAQSSIIAKEKDEIHTITGISKELVSNSNETTWQRRATDIQISPQTELQNTCEQVETSILTVDRLKQFPVSVESHEDSMSIQSSKPMELTGRKEPVTTKLEADLQPASVIEQKDQTVLPIAQQSGSQTSKIQISEIQAEEQKPAIDIIIPLKTTSDEQQDTTNSVELHRPVVSEEHQSVLIQQTKARLAEEHKQTLPRKNQPRVLKTLETISVLDGKAVEIADEGQRLSEEKIPMHTVPIVNKEETITSFGPFEEHKLTAGEAQTWSSIDQQQTIIIPEALPSFASNNRVVPMEQLILEATEANKLLEVQHTQPNSAEEHLIAAVESTQPKPIPKLTLEPSDQQAVVQAEQPLYKAVTELESKSIEKSKPRGLDDRQSLEVHPTEFTPMERQKTVTNEQLQLELQLVQKRHSKTTENPQLEDLEDQIALEAKQSELQLQLTEKQKVLPIEQVQWKPESASEKQPKSIGESKVEALEDKKFIEMEGIQLETTTEPIPELLEQQKRELFGEQQLPRVAEQISKRVEEQKSTQTKRSEFSPLQEWQSYSMEGANLKAVDHGEFLGTQQAQLKTLRDQSLIETGQSQLKSVTEPIIKSVDQEKIMLVEQLQPKQTEQPTSKLVEEKKAVHIEQSVEEQPYKLIQELKLELVGDQELEEAKHAEFQPVTEPLPKLVDQEKLALAEQSQTESVLEEKGKRVEKLESKAVEHLKFLETEKLSFPSMTEVIPKPIYHQKSVPSEQLQPQTQQTGELTPKTIEGQNSVQSQQLNLQLKTALEQPQKTTEESKLGAVEIRELTETEQPKLRFTAEHKLVESKQPQLKTTTEPILASVSEQEPALVEQLQPQRTEESMAIIVEKQNAAEMRQIKSKSASEEELKLIETPKSGLVDTKKSLEPKQPYLEPMEQQMSGYSRQERMESMTERLPGPDDQQQQTKIDQIHPKPVTVQIPKITEGEKSHIVEQLNTMQSRESETKFASKSKPTPSEEQSDTISLKTELKALIETEVAHDQAIQSKLATEPMIEHYEDQKVEHAQHRLVLEPKSISNIKVKSAAAEVQKLAEDEMTRLISPDPQNSAQSQESQLKSFATEGLNAASEQKTFQIQQPELKTKQDKKQTPIEQFQQQKTAQSTIAFTEEQSSVRFEPPQDKLLQEEESAIIESGTFKMVEERQPVQMKLQFKATENLSEKSVNEPNSKATQQQKLPETNFTLLQQLAQQGTHAADEVKSETTRKNNIIQTEQHQMELKSPQEKQSMSLQQQSLFTQTTLVESKDKIEVDEKLQPIQETRKFQAYSGETSTHKNTQDTATTIKMKPCKPENTQSSVLAAQVGDETKSLIAQTQKQVAESYQTQQIAHDQDQKTQPTNGQELISKSIIPKTHDEPSALQDTIPTEQAKSERQHKQRKTGAALTKSSTTTTPTSRSDTGPEEKDDLTSLATAPSDNKNKRSIEENKSETQKLPVDKKEETSTAQKAATAEEEKVKPVDKHKKVDGVVYATSASEAKEKEKEKVQITTSKTTPPDEKKTKSMEKKTPDTQKITVDKKETITTQEAVPVEEAKVTPTDKQKKTDASVPKESADVAFATSKIDIEQKGKVETTAQKPSDPDSKKKRSVEEKKADDQKTTVDKKEEPSTAQKAVSAEVEKVKPVDKHKKVDGVVYATSASEAKEKEKEKVQITTSKTTPPDEKKTKSMEKKTPDTQKITVDKKETITTQEAVPVEEAKVTPTDKQKKTDASVPKESADVAFATSKIDIEQKGKVETTAQKPSDPDSKKKRSVEEKKADDQKTTVDKKEEPSTAQKAVSAEEEKVKPVDKHKKVDGVVYATFASEGKEKEKEKVQITTSKTTPPDEKKTKSMEKKTPDTQKITVDKKETITTQEAVPVEEAKVTPTDKQKETDASVPKESADVAFATSKIDIGQKGKVEATAKKSSDPDSKKKRSVEEKKADDQKTTVDKKEEPSTAQKAVSAEVEKVTPIDKQKKIDSGVSKQSVVAVSTAADTESEGKWKAQNATEKTTASDEKKTKPIEKERVHVRKSSADLNDELNTAEKSRIVEAEKQSEGTQRRMTLDDAGEKRRKVSTQQLESTIEEKASFIDLKASHEASTFNRLSEALKEASHVEAIKMTEPVGPTSPDSPSTLAEHDFLIPNFTLRLKPTTKVNDREKLKLEVRFIAEPQATVQNVFHNIIDE